MLAGEALTARRIDDYFQQELIDKRNQRMAQRVHALLKEFPDKSFFFAFGAGEKVTSAWGRLGERRGGGGGGGGGGVGPVNERPAQVQFPDKSFFAFGAGQSVSQKKPQPGGWGGGGGGGGGAGLNPIVAWGVNVMSRGALWTKHVDEAGKT